MAVGVVVLCVGVVPAVRVVSVLCDVDVDVCGVYFVMLMLMC